MNYLLFQSSESLESFLKRRVCPEVENKIEWCVMEKFPVNRILFTAEHAVVARIDMKEFGAKAYTRVGDKNTGLLARLAAHYTRSAYVIPRFLRTEADAARPPEDLGKGLRLFVRVFYSKQATTYVPIHSNPAYLSCLEKYHQTIEQLNPKAIVSVHGMNVKRKFDVLFGFGENYECIGGKKEAFRFKNEFASYMDDVLKGMNGNLNIAVSTWLLTGSRNYVLTKHVAEYNKMHENKRIGMQVEFNWKGRIMNNDRTVPSIPYQAVVQALGDFVFKWTNNSAR
jgi:hypothetical protein